MSRQSCDSETGTLLPKQYVAEMPSCRRTMADVAVIDARLAAPGGVAEELCASCGTRIAEGATFRDQRVAKAA